MPFDFGEAEDKRGTPLFYVVDRLPPDFGAVGVALRGGQRVGSELVLISRNFRNWKLKVLFC
jgi:hypothetical protein